MSKLRKILAILIIIAVTVDVVLKVSNKEKLQ